MGLPRVNNTRFKLDDVQKFVFSYFEAVNSYQPDLWKKCVQHVKKEIDEDWLHELDDQSVQEILMKTTET